MQTQQEQWEEWDQKHVWHPFTQMQDYQQQTPLVIEKAEGVYLYDIYGQRYIDGVSSLWVNVHGHRVPEIDQAVREQLNKVAHTTLLGLGNVPSIELAKMLVDISPVGLDKVFYSDSGSTAAEIAVKMAYQYWQQVEGKQTPRTKFAHLKNSYHGDTIGSVSVGGIDLFHKVYKHLLFETIAVPVADSYRFEGAGDWSEVCFRQLEETFQKHGHELAAIIVEPLIQGAAGMLLFPEGYLRRVRELCDRYNVLMIVDEVATGFGRTGRMFACEHEDVSPDMMLLAKGLTGGYLPVAVTLTNTRVFDSFADDHAACKTFFHGHTYTGNPLGCAAAIASLRLMQDRNIVDHVEQLAREIQPQLQALLDLPHVGNIRQRGLMIGIELVQDKATKRPFPWENKVGVQVIERVRERGVIIRPLGNVIVLMPPLVIEAAVLKELIDTVAWAIQDVIEN